MCTQHIDNAKSVLSAFCLLAAIISPGSSEARADSNVSVATLAIGRLYVIGKTEKPNTPVILDRRFHTTSDASGMYAFEEIYHPASCIIGVDIEARTFRAVVSNCAQQTPIVRLPFLSAAFPDLNDRAWALPPKPDPAVARSKPRTRLVPARTTGQKPTAGAAKPPAAIE